MSKLKQFISELRELEGKVPFFPNKKFPIVMIQEEYELINHYTQFGLDMKHELPRLLDLLERAVETIEFYADENNYDEFGVPGHWYPVVDSRTLGVVENRFKNDEGKFARDFLETDPSTRGKERGE